MIVFLVPLILSFGITPSSFSEEDAELSQICIDKVLIEKSKGRIACVTSSTGEKLVQRGWGLQEDDSMEKVMPQMPSWNDGTAKSEIMAFVLVHKDLVVYLIQWVSQV